MIAVASQNCGDVIGGKACRWYSRYKVFCSVLEEVEVTVEWRAKAKVEWRFL